MKAKKALKRLAKIEVLLSDVTKRFPNTSLQIQGALKDAKAAFARVKEAVSLQVSAEAANDSKAHSRTTPKPAKRQLSPVVKQAIQERVPGRMAKKTEATANATQSTKKAVPARKKAAAKPMAVRATTTKTARKRVPIKKTAKKHAAPKKTAHASVEIPATVETIPDAVETTPADIETQTEPAHISVGE